MKGVLPLRLADLMLLTHSRADRSLPGRQGGKGFSLKLWSLRRAAVQQDMQAFGPIDRKGTVGTIHDPVLQSR